MESSCYKCGSMNLDEDYSKPPTFIVSCKDCGYRVVTSKFPAIFSDETNYKVYLLKTENKTKETLLIKTIKELSLNEAKEFYQKETKILLFKGVATEIFNSVKQLEKEYKITVEPKFNYTDQDLNGMKLAMPI